MNQHELGKALFSANIREDVYSVFGADYDERLVLNQLPNSNWEVYYCERGLKSNSVQFNNESSACDYFYKTILSDPLSRQK